MKNLFLVFGCILFVSCSGNSALEKNLLDEVSPKGGAQLWRFAVISDLNGSYGSKKYKKDVSLAVDYITDKKNNVDFVISTGDMVAGQKSGLDYKGMWESFHNNVTRRFSKLGLALYPSPGNHDAYVSRRVERDHYEKSWNDEDQLKMNRDFKFVKGVVQNYPFQYAFTIGPALFISLDSSDLKPYTDEKIQWIVDVLEESKGVKHKFIFGHVPLVPFAFKREMEYSARGSVSFLKTMEEILEKYSVDIFFSGHHHVYYPGRRHGKTQFVSVPLLGEGARHLITRGKLTARSAHGFLIVEYAEGGAVDMKSLSSQKYKTIADHSLPPFLSLPENNSKICRACTAFPKEMFLNPDERTLYIRRDL